MVTCAKCDYAFDPESAPGGQCPRCLLLGIHEDEMDLLPEDDHVTTTANAADPAAHAQSLEIDELAAELPGFELEEPIGRGGMGVVWRARERLLDRHVAIKLLRNVDKDPAFVERFTREARVMARMNHPNVVTLYTFGRTRSNHCYMVMELIDGMDLAQVMAKGSIDLPSALAIVSDICEALEPAHRAGFVHRDMKPGNVLLDKNGLVKVVDFGLARLARPLDPTTLSITKHGHAVGTPQYIAPEQARGRGSEDHRADIYSLGVMLYEMLTGELPRGIFKPPSHKAKVSRQLDRIVMRALQEDPAQRYQDIMALKTDLWKVRKKVDPQLIAQQHETRHDSRWRRRAEMLLATAVASLLGIICAWYAREWLEPMPARASRPAVIPVSAYASGAPDTLGASSSKDISERSLSGLNMASGLVFQKEVRLQPADLPHGSDFGGQIASWDSWLAVSAHSAPLPTGRARGVIFIYRRSQEGRWELVQRLSPPRPEMAVSFGTSIAMHNGLLVVGSAALLRLGDSASDLFEYEPSQQQWRLHQSPPFTSNPEFRINRTNLSAHQSRVATLGISPSNQRCLVIADRQPDGRWVESIIYPENGIPVGKCTIAEDGTVYCALTGVEREADNSHSGGVLIIWKKDGVWHNRALPCPPDPAVFASSFFSVSTRGNQMLLGAYRMQNKDGLGWVLQCGANGEVESEGYLLPQESGTGGEFGKSVLVGAGWLAVGADYHRVDARHRGAVHFYSRSSATNTWARSGTLLANASTGANDFGNYLTLGDHFIAVGAPLTHATGKSSINDEHAPGAVFIYEWER